MTSRLALAAALTVALAACGSDDASEEAAEAAGEEVVARDDTALADGDAIALEGEEIAEAEASPTPTPTPTEARTPTPTPSVTARATTVATATASPGEPPAAFDQCAICHKVERGEHGLGPSLAGVFGKRAAQAAGFSYSPAMRSANLTWNQANLDRFLANPQAVVPGTTMAHAGVKDAGQRAAIIAYLKTL